MNDSVTVDRSLPLARHATLSSGLWIAAFAALTWAGAQIQIPTQPVPMTLQTPFVLLAGALLGARMGALSQLAYLAAGAVGLPVFASHHLYGIGPGYFLWSPTAGYLLGFPIAAFVCGALLHNRALRARLSGYLLALAAMVVGLVAVFTLGTLKLALHFGWPVALDEGFASLQLWDAVKVGGAALLASAVVRR